MGRCTLSDCHAGVGRFVCTAGCRGRASRQVQKSSFLLDHNIFLHCDTHISVLNQYADSIKHVRLDRQQETLQKQQELLQVNVTTLTFETH